MCAAINGVSLDQILFCYEASDSFFHNDTLIEPIELVAKGGSGETGMPLFFAGRVNEDLYIVVRGATEAHDFLTVLNFAHIPLADGEVHAGVLKAARWIIEQCRQYIDECKGHIYVTGHSLGGATSAVIATLLRLEEGKTNVTAITAAAFPVFTEPLRKKSEEFVTALVYNNDIVPHLTHKAIIAIINQFTGGQLSPQALIMAQMMLQQMIEGILKTRGMDDPKIFASLQQKLPQQMMQLMMLAQSDCPDLELAGVVTRVVIGQDSEPSLAEFTSGIALNPLMIPLMVQDHNLQLLIEALKKLNVPIPDGPTVTDDLD